MKKILFIGGTGVISSACTPAAMAAGFEVTLLNLGSKFYRQTIMILRMWQSNWLADILILWSIG